MSLFNTSKKLQIPPEFQLQNVHNGARRTQCNPPPHKQTHTYIKEGEKGWTLPNLT